MKTLNTNHPLIDSVIEQSAPYVAKCVEEYIVWYNAESAGLVAKGNAELKPLTQYDLDIYAADIKIPMIKALGNYTLRTDILNSVEYSWANYKGVSFSLTLTRDGKSEYISAESIIAHGEVQCRHARYIVKTNLRKLGVDLTKQLRGIDKAQYDLDYMLGVVAREEAILVTIEAETVETMTEEVYGYWNSKGISRNQMWEALVPQAKENYGSEVELLKYWDAKVTEKVEGQPRRIKGVKNTIKECKAKLPKLEAKLAALKAAL